MNSAQIHINDATTDMRFVWIGFDGDDCFDDFHIDVIGESGSRQFSFGPLCRTWSQKGEQVLSG
jgi:hypothetical protein